MVGVTPYFFKCGAILELETFKKSKGKTYTRILAKRIFTP